MSRLLARLRTADALAWARATRLRWALVRLALVTIGAWLTLILVIGWQVAREPFPDALRAVPSGRS